MNITTHQANMENRQTRPAAEAAPPRKNNGATAEFIDKRPAAIEQEILQRIMLGRGEGLIKHDRTGATGYGTAQGINLDKGLNKSEADSSIEIGDNTSVITATKVGGLIGHTRLFFEHKNQQEQLKNIKVELEANASGSSGIETDISSWPSSVITSGRKGGSSTKRSTGGFTRSTSSPTSSLSKPGPAGKEIEIIIFDEYTSIERNIGTGAKKKYWQTTRGQAQAGLDKAKEIQDAQDTYSYRLLVDKDDYAKKLINCASFGEKVLEAASIAASATSFLGYKTPGGLISD